MPDQDKPAVQVGKVELVEPSGMDQYAAVLWVPDPEQRHGWREYYVRQRFESKPGERERERMGF